MDSLLVYNPTNHKLGDTFDGLEITLKINGVAENLTGYTIVGEFRLGFKTSTPIKTVAIGTGITVTDAANGICKIDAFNIVAGSPGFTKSGTYYLKVKFIKAGRTKTRVEGTWIIED